jgi:hypothetical protein
MTEEPGSLKAAHVRCWIRICWSEVGATGYAFAVSRVTMRRSRRPLRLPGREPDERCPTTDSPMLNANIAPPKRLARASDRCFGVVRGAALALVVACLAGCTIEGRPGTGNPRWWDEGPGADGPR